MVFCVLAEIPSFPVWLWLWFLSSCLVLPKVQVCHTPTLAKSGGEAQHLEKLGVGVLRDSRMFRAQQQEEKHLALGCSWFHWKFLKRRYRKCPRIGNSDICSPSYGQKKGRESNWQFDSRPLKVGMSDSGIQHGVGKILTRATTLV
jgi:hypothetical protein